MDFFKKYGLTILMTALSWHAAFAAPNSALSCEVLFNSSGQNSVLWKADVLGELLNPYLVTTTIDASQATIYFKTEEGEQVGAGFIDVNCNNKPDSDGSLPVKLSRNKWGVIFNLTGRLVDDTHLVVENVTYSDQFGLYTGKGTLVRVSPGPRQKLKLFSK